MPIPSLDGIAAPVLADLDSVDVMALQRPAATAALHRLRPVQPGTSTGRIQQPTAAFMAPAHEIATRMTGQIIQNEHHAQGREAAIHLRGPGKRGPISPVPPFCNDFWGGRTLLETGLQLPVEPGMQDGGGTGINGFSSQGATRGPKQREQFAGLAAKRVMVLLPWGPLGLPGEARMRNRLLRTRLVFTP